MLLSNLFRFEFIRFLFVGALNTLLGYFIYVVIFFFIKDKNLTLILTYIIAVGINYKNFSKFVFTKNYGRFINFIMIYIFSFCFNMLLLWILVDEVLFNVYLSQFISIIIIAPIIYVLNKKFVFVD
jgi:putative flippase GtrA